MRRRGLRPETAFVFVGAACLTLCGLFARPASRRPAGGVATATAAEAAHLRHVNREGIGSGWPLAVGEADVGCDGPARTPRLFVLVNGVRYGLNHHATRALGYADLGRATVAGGRPLWKDAPPGKAGAAKLPTTALLREAGALCHP